MTSKQKPRTVSELMLNEKLEEVERKSKEITAWMESLLNEKLPKPTLRENLLDGVFLCKLVNALVPGALKKYHKKPKMLAMKIENIGFFLATCKTRLNLPPALLFQPTDLHDDSDTNSIRKVLNVLSFLQGDNDFLKPPEPDTNGGEEPEQEHPTPATVAAAKPEPSHTTNTHTHTNTTTSRHTSSAPVHQSNSSGLETDWYLHNQKSSYVDIQDEVLSVILDTANVELSVDSKRKLLRRLQAQISFVEEKVLSSSDDQLRTLAHSMGLGETLEDIPLTKGRDWLVEFILKYGRAH